MEPGSAEKWSAATHGQRGGFVNGCCWGYTDRHRARLGLLKAVGEDRCETGRGGAHLESLQFGRLRQEDCKLKPNLGN